MLLDMMKEMYRQSGVKCDTCQSVDELTDRMRTKDYDLLVTDLKMPEVNGYEVLELLRTSEIGNSQTIPVVAATAAGYVEEKELTEKGFAAVLYKPYSIDELLAVTERCIKPKGTSNIDCRPCSLSAISGAHWKSWRPRHNPTWMKCARRRKPGTWRRWTAGYTTSEARGC